jgi:opacity protein-like surface antigen
MKRKLLVLFMAASAMVSVSAQEQQKIDYSHWSVNLKGGLDYTRYELGESGIMTSDNLGYALGLGIEYTINPLLGFGAEYAYMAHETGLADATANDISVYGSLNLLNLFVPNRPGCWNKFNIYGNVGAGYGFYAYNIDGGGSGDVEAPLTTYAVNAEYALSDSWALGLESQYVDYSREDLTRSVTP